MSSPHKSKFRFVIVTLPNGEAYWNLVAPSGAVVIQSDDIFKSPRAARAGANSARHAITSATVVTEKQDA